MMRASNSLILAFLMLSVLLLHSFNYYNHMDRESTKKMLIDHKSNTPNFQLKATESQFLGYYVRGEDFCKINFTLIDSETGEPIPNAPIEVYLNYSDGDIYLGENYTDSNGKFVYVFFVETYFPRGEVNITAIFSGDPVQGYGEARAYYWAIFYGKILVGVRTDSISKPLFEKNITITAWAYLDSGEAYRQASLNFSIKVIHEESSSISIYTIQGDANGIATLTFDYTSTGKGNYTVVAQLNGTNNIIQPYLLFQNQDMDRDGNIIGDPYSESTSRFSVVIASKIEASFGALKPQRTSLDAYLNETVTLVGLYYNATGERDKTVISIIFYLGRTPVYSQDIETDADGFFQFVFEPLLILNGVGTYYITFQDNNASTKDISPTLRLNVYSYLRVNASILDSSTIYMVGENITVSGIVYDSITGENISNVVVKVFLEEDQSTFLLGSNSTDSNGRFYLTNLTIPLTARGPNATLIISTDPPNPYYNVLDWNSTIDIFTTLNVSFEVNDSRFTWLVTRATLTPISGDTFRVSGESDLLLVVFPLRDEYDRLILLPLEIYLGDILIYQGLINEELTLIIHVNESESLTVLIDSLPILTLNLVVGGTGGGPGNFTFPLFSVMIFPLILIGLLVFRFRSKLALIRSFRVEGESLENKVEDIRILIEGGRFEEAADKIQELLKDIAKSLKVDIRDSFTAREILDLIYPFIEKDIYQILMKLVYVYEEIKYGHRIPDHRSVESIISDLPLLKHITPSAYPGDLE